MPAWSWCRERAGPAVAQGLRGPCLPGGDARDLLPDPLRDHGGDELLSPDRGRVLRTSLRARELATPLPAGLPGASLVLDRDLPARRLRLHRDRVPVHVLPDPHAAAAAGRA